MALNLLDRVSTLLKADAHGVVESLEERTLLMKQYLREAELAFDQNRARLEALHDETKQLVDAIRRGEVELAALDEDVQLALGAGKEDLARFALRRLIPRRKEVGQWRAHLATRTAESGALAERVTQQQAQLDSLRTRVQAELRRERSTDATAPLFGEPPVADEEVELELMRRRPRSGGVA